MAMVCVFDVNETLLDLGALDPHFERIFGDTGLRRQWFNQMLQLAFVSTITGAYRDFGALGGAALEMLARREERALRAEDRVTILGAMRRLPPHPDVPAALGRLRDAGLRLATLTNSTLQVARAQLEYAGLTPYFEQILSADTVWRLKPAPEPYRMAAAGLGVEVGQVLLIAAHAWDVAGAMSAGCAAAFVGRSGQVLDPLSPAPEIVGVDLPEVADRILALDAPTMQAR